MKIALLLILAALTGCATMSTQQNIAGVCQGIASSEQALALVQDKLTPAQRDAVAKAVAIKAPICNHAPFPTTVSDATYQELTGVLATLQGIKP